MKHCLNIKQEFSLNLQEQNNKNLEKMKDLLSGIIQSKTTIDQQFGKAIDNIQQWITTVEKQNTIIKLKVDELNTLITKEFQQALIGLQQNNTEILELKLSIQQSLMQIVKGENIQQSFELLDTIQFIEYDTDCRLYEKDQDIKVQKIILKLLCLIQIKREIVKIYQLVFIAYIIYCQIIDPC